MNWYRFIFFLLPIILLGLAGCSRDPEILAGGGSDLPEVSGYVHLEDGTVAADAQIRLIPGEYHPGFNAELDEINKKTGATIQTDGAGAFAVEDVDPGTYYLEVLSADSSEIAISRHFEQEDSTSFDLGILVTEPAASISGTILSNRKSVESVYLAGTHLYDRPDENGRYVIPAIPGGEYVLCAGLREPSMPKAGWGFAPQDSNIWIMADSLVLKPGEDRDLGIMHILYDSLLLWEFEGETQNALKGIVFPEDNTSAGKWSPLPMDLVTEDVYRGTSSIRLSIGTGYQFKIVEGYEDLTRMEAFVLYARGPGKIRVTFRSREVQTGEGSFISEAGVPVEWTRISITPEDIYPVPGSESYSLGRTWDDVKSGVTIIDLHVLQGTEIFVDDIYFVGMRSEDFYFN